MLALYIGLLDVQACRVCTFTVSVCMLYVHTATYACLKPRVHVPEAEESPDPFPVPVVWGRSTGHDREGVHASQRQSITQCT